MTNLTVLGDGAIKQILLGLTKEEIGSFREKVEDCLISISPGWESDFQPSPGIINRPEGQKILFRPFTSPENAGTKIIMQAAPEPEGTESTPETRKQQALHGILVILDKCGIPTGVLNAEEITGYRTTMSAMIPYSWRQRTDHVVIYGAGKQALWHTRLILALRGEDIKSINIVNRSEDRARELIQTIQEENNRYWKSSCQIEFLSSTDPGTRLELEKALGEADVIFCTVASQKPLFSLGALQLENREGRYPLISAVGSWQPDMIEVDPTILHHITQTKGYSLRGLSNGTVIVDDGKHALLHAGEIVQGGLNKDQILDIGQVLTAKRNPSVLGLESTDGLDQWLAEGLIVYKSIGVSVTDLAAGNAILALAAKKNLGSLITDF